MSRLFKNITIICLCLILIGIGFTGTGLLLGGTPSFAYHAGSHKLITPKDLNYKMVTEDIDAFTSIDLTTDTENIIINLATLTLFRIRKANLTQLIIPLEIMSLL